MQVLTSQRLNNGNPRLVYCHVIELKNRKEQSFSDHKVHNKQELHILIQHIQLITLNRIAKHADSEPFTYIDTILKCLSATRDYPLQCLLHNPLSI